MAARHRARWRVLALIAVLSVVAAACGSSKKSSTNKSGSSSTSTSGTVKIGYFGPLTGSNSPELGVNIRNAVKVAVDQYNAQGKSPKVQLIEYDSQGDPAQAPQLAQKAISDKVVAVVGPAFSGESKAVDGTFEEAHIVDITASATSDALSTHGWKYFHRALRPNADEGSAAVKYINGKLHAKTIAVIDDNSEYGKGLADVVRNGIKPLGINMAVSESIDTKNHEYSTTVNKVKGANVAAIFFGGYYSEGGPLVKQLRDAGVTAPFISDDGSKDQKLVDAAGAAAEGAILACPCGDITADPKGADFVTAYKAAWHTDPGTFSAEAYDAANVVLQAIAAGKTTGPDINTYVTNVDYQGITKEIKFDAKGEVSTGGVFLYQVKSGKIVVLGTADEVSK